MFRKLGVLLLLLSMGCSNPIERILESDHNAIKKVADSLQKYEVQVIYTQIDSTENGYVFKDYSFQSDPKNYFYPASTVKLPVALLATEYVANHPELTIDTPYSIENDSVPHTIAKDIKQIFAVSDNQAYNRLYELLGRDYINNRLEELGLKNTRIAHRLSTPDAGRSTRRKIQLYPSYEGEIFVPEIPADGDIEPLRLKNIQKGTGYIKEGVLIDSPMDFSLKNSFPLQDQHQLMKQFFFKDNFKTNKRIKINPTEEIRVKNFMFKLPRQSGYNPNDYYDSYVKFFLFRDRKDTIPSHIKIYNKVGYAYGTLTETAYIVDEHENVQFLLSATVLVNGNGVFNDDTYEYNSVGIPFLAQLGREFYKYSLENKNEDL